MLEKYAHPASQEASRLEKYAHPACQEASRLEEYAHPERQKLHPCGKSCSTHCKSTKKNDGAVPLPRCLSPSCASAPLYLRLRPLNWPRRESRSVYNFRYYLRVIRRYTQFVFQEDWDKLLESLVSGVWRQILAPEPKKILSEFRV